MEENKNINTVKVDFSEAIYNTVMTTAIQSGFDRLDNFVFHLYNSLLQAQSQPNVTTSPSPQNSNSSNNIDAPSRSKKHLWYIIISGIVMLVLLGLVLFLFFSNRKNKNIAVNAATSKQQAFNSIPTPK